MHLTDMSAGFLAAIPIVGSSLPIAAGVAMSQKWHGADDLTVVYIGDAAIESGSFHETMNFASLHSLPLLTVCENNEYSIFTPLSVRQPSNRTIRELAESHGVRSFYGNGDDVLEVAKIVEEAINYMILESKPAFVEFRTYRLLEHCGPNFDDNLNYRDPLEIKDFEQRDPLAILHNRLLKDNPKLSSILIEFETEVRTLIENLILNVKLAPLASHSLVNSMFWKSI